MFCDTRYLLYWIATKVLCFCVISSIVLMCSFYFNMASGYMASEFWTPQFFRPPQTNIVVYFLSVVRPQMLYHFSAAKHLNHAEVNVNFWHFDILPLHVTRSNVRHPYLSGSITSPIGFVGIKLIRRVSLNIAVSSVKLPNIYFLHQKLVFFNFLSNDIWSDIITLCWNAEFLWIVILSCLCPSCFCHALFIPLWKQNALWELLFVGLAECF